MSSFLLSGVELSAVAIRIGICHAQATNALGGETTTTGTLGGSGFPSGSTVSTVELTLDVAADGVIVEAVSCRPREGEVGFPREQLARRRPAKKMFAHNGLLRKPRQCIAADQCELRHPLHL